MLMVLISRFRFFNLCIEKLVVSHESLKVHTDSYGVLSFKYYVVIDVSQGKIHLLHIIEKSRLFNNEEELSKTAAHFYFDCRSENKN